MAVTTRNGHIAGSPAATVGTNSAALAIPVNNTAGQPTLTSQRQLHSHRPVKLTKRKRLTKNRALREEAVNSSTSQIRFPSSPEHEVMFFCVERDARRYNVFVASIWRWVKEGKFPDSVKTTNGTTRWSRSTLEAYDQNQGSSK